MNEEVLDLRDGTISNRELPKSYVLPLIDLEGKDNAINSMVKWIEQDSSSQPEKYLEDCDTKICGE